MDLGAAGGGTIVHNASESGIRPTRGELPYSAAKAASDDIDAVVLDLSMPDVDGEQTFREIRRLRPRIPVLLVSGYSEEMAAANFIGTEDADAFLSKPYLPDDLIERVREVLVS